MSQLLAQSKAAKIVYDLHRRGWRSRGRVCRLRVIFIREVAAGQEIERGSVALDGVVANTNAAYRSQIQVLQRVAHQVCAYKPKHARIDIAVIANPTRLNVGGRAGSGELVRAVHNSRVQAELVVLGSSCRVESNRKILRLAIAAG